MVSTVKTAKRVLALLLVLLMFGGNFSVLTAYAEPDEEPVSVEEIVTETPSAPAAEEPVTEAVSEAEPEPETPAQEQEAAPQETEPAATEQPQQEPAPSQETPASTEASDPVETPTEQETPTETPAVQETETTTDTPTAPAAQEPASEEETEPAQGGEDPTVTEPEEADPIEPVIEPCLQELTAELKDEQDRVYFTAKLQAILPEGTVFSIVPVAGTKENTVFALTISLITAEGLPVTEGSFSLLFEGAFIGETAEELQVWTVLYGTETRVYSASVSGSKITLTAENLRGTFEIRTKAEEEIPAEETEELQTAVQTTGTEETPEPVEEPVVTEEITAVEAKAASRTAEDETTAVSTVSADFVFPDAQVRLADILAAVGKTAANNSTLSVDSDLIELSDTVVKNKNLDSITLTAKDHFDLATLTISKNKDVLTINLSYPASSEPGGEEETVTLKNYAPSEAIWANEDLYLTGKMPGNAVVEATPVTVEIDGEYVIAAYDISIYANANQQAKGKTWQPADEKVQVHFYAEGAEGAVHVWHMADGAATPELVDTVQAENGWVEFEAEHFSTYGFSFFEDLFNHTVNAVRNALYPDTVYENDAIILTGNLPRNAVIEAEKVDVEIEGRETIVAYDIKIYQNSFFKLLGIAWQPDNDSITVQIKSDALAQLEHSVNIYHMADTGAEAELIDEDVAVENGSITFAADSFSVYAISDEYLRTYHFITYNNSTDMQYVEYQIYTDLGTTTYTQTIKNGESLVIPQLPALAGSSTSTFSGWYAAEGVTCTDGVYTYTSISDEPFDFENIPEVTQTETVYLFAKFSDYAYVVFHDQYNGASGGFPVASTRRAEKVNGTASIQISDFSVSYDDNSDENTAPSMAFHGWSLTPITTPGSSTDDSGNPVSMIETDSVTISGSESVVHLYPVFMPIHWLNFWAGPTGSGATYIPSAYYYEGEGRTSTPVPVRSGYTFAGWYTGSADGDNVTYGVKIANADGSLIEGASDANISVSNGMLLLTGNTTIYARWEESGVNYSVVIWRQKSTDEANLANSAKTYDYAESFPLTAVSGSTVSVANTYKNFSGSGEYVGFTYSRCDDSTTVNADGSTVLNVYYDRNVHTLTFRVTDYTYTVSNNDNDNNPSKYGVVNGQWARVYWANGVFRTSNSNNGTVYTGTVYTRSNNTSTQTVKTITALYGASIQSQFPIIDNRGVSYNGYSWTASNTQVYAYALATIETMPNADVTFTGSSRGTSKTIYYYVEIGNESESLGTIRHFNNKLYTLYKTVNHNYNYITYDEEYHPITGYIRSYTNAEPAFNTSNDQASIGSGNVNYLYYDRDSFEIAFLDSYTSSYAYVNGEQVGDTDILFSEAIKNYLPDDPTAVQIIGGEIIARDGYEFTGWYTDPACTTRVFFENNEEYRNYSDSKVLYEKMPAYNLRFYAGWDTIWYLIQIDPNYGTMNSGTVDSTWFWEPYNGDPIEEYTWVKRDYEESVTGSYYYVKHDRAYYGYGDEYVSGESTERHTYYTTNPGEATELTTFKYAQNAYRYAGWYEIHEDGSETLYHFGEPVTHDTRLILHWKKIGTYYVSYNAVVEQDGTTIAGSIDNGDANEQLFFELDGEDYADNAEVVVTRTAHAPESYNFIGWKIRGDDSGTIYYPGQSFVFLSRYAVTITENGESHETIFLDAVYSYVETAKIIYDANGGVIDPQIVDYGSPTDTSITPNTSCDTEANTATISNLVNNSGIVLSNGEGFSLEGATLTGWNTEPDASGTHFDLGSDEFYVDNTEPETLYAEWQVKVYFHLNKPATEANFGGTWDPDVYTLENDTLYSRMVYVNSSVDQPAVDPVYTGEEDLFFHFWGTQRYGDDTLIDEYDFSQPVTGELHLYAYWAGPIEVPVHAVDSSAEVLADKDAEWLTVPAGTVIEVAADPIDLATEADARIYAENVPSGYEFAFAAVHSSTAGIQSISENEAITQLYYDSSEKAVYVRYADGRTAPLADEDEVYLVFYEKKSLPIGYKLVNQDESLTEKHADTSTGYLGDTAMAGEVTNPLTISGYANNGSVYYAYAIGQPDATSSSQLQVISSTSRNQNNGYRPNLQIRNTWRGFEYSMDGTSWTKCGYSDEIQLYAVYFESRPTIVTINEKTIGTLEDMEEQFEYVVTVEETTTTTISVQTQRRSWGQWYDDGDPSVTTTTGTPSTILDNSTDPYLLSDGESKAVTLFYGETESSEPGQEYTSWGTRYRDVTTTTVVTTQTITVTQTPKSAFTTDHDGEGSSEYVYTYTTAADSTDQSVTYTNTHTPLTVEVHVAIVSGGSIILDDEERATPYSFTLELGQEKTLLDVIAASSLFTGDSSIYSFAGVVYGMSGDDQGDSVTVLGADVSSIGYTQLTPPAGNIYELCINSDTAEQLGTNKIYYLYYPMPKVVYVKETAGGTLEEITGAGAGDVTYSGVPLTLNGVTVSQGQKLSVSDSVFQISQTVGSGNFNMPPRLDDEDEELFLLYTKLGAGDENVASIDLLDTWTDEKAMQLKVTDNQVKWSVDGETWNTFSGTPTVYAIYKEIGYDLTIRKSLDGGDSSKSFVLYIRSTAITETSYAVTGTGTATVSATPASGSNPGSIRLSIHHGSEITISGLGSGDYTLEEAGSGFELYEVSVDGEQQTVQNNTVSFTIESDTAADLSNRLVNIAPTGLHTNLRPYLWMVLAGGLMGLGCLVLRLRRRKEEEE